MEENHTLASAPLEEAEARLDRAAQAAAPDAGPAGDGATAPRPQTAQTAPPADVAQEPDREDNPDLRDAWEALQREGETMGALVPGFSLEREMADGAFAALTVRLQQSGWPDPVRTAWETVHRRELLCAAMRYAADRTRRQMADSIRSAGARPAENGGGPAARVGVDPAHLSPAQREDIRRRVRRGERVTF